jgi:linoleate 10R-lipoxygenase
MAQMTVYDDLSHPPATYIGPEYQYRRADGSGNNICDPDMGKACMPYARSVQQTHPIPLNTLPDAGLVFDTLLKRQKVRFSPCLYAYGSSLTSYYLV